MTPEEYADALRRISEYETLAKLRDTYKRIRDTAHLVVIRCNDGSEIELKGAEPIAALQGFVLAKLNEIDQQKTEV